MLDPALKARGIEDAQTGTLLVAAIGKPGAGRVDLVVRNGIQPLGRAEWLHAAKLLVSGGLAVWPELTDTLATVVEAARAHANPPPAEARS